MKSFRIEHQGDEYAIFVSVKRGHKILLYLCLTVLLLYIQYKFCFDGLFSNSVIASYIFMAISTIAQSWLIYKCLSLIKNNNTNATGWVAATISGISFFSMLQIALWRNADEGTDIVDAIIYTLIPIGIAYIFCFLKCIYDRRKTTI